MILSRKSWLVTKGMNKLRPSYKYVGEISGGDKYEQYNGLFRLERGYRL